MKTTHILIGSGLLALGLIAGRFFIPDEAAATGADTMQAQSSETPASVWTCSMQKLNIRILLL